MVDLGVGMFVILRAGHSRVTITKEEDILQSQNFGSALQLRRTELGGVLEAIEMFRIYCADFAARCTDQIGVITLLRIQRKGTTQTKRFVIGVSQNCQDCLRHVSSCMARGATSPV